MRWRDLLPVFVAATCAGACAKPLDVAVDLTDPAVPVFGVTSDGAAVPAVTQIRVKRCAECTPPIDDDEARAFLSSPARDDDDWRWGVSAERVAVEGARTPSLGVPLTYGAVPPLAFVDDGLTPLPLEAGDFMVGVLFVAGVQQGDAFATFTVP